MRFNFAIMLKGIVQRGFYGICEERKENAGLSGVWR
jgi:hypothetical protein